MQTGLLEQLSRMDVTNWLSVVDNRASDVILVQTSIADYFGVQRTLKEIRGIYRQLRLV